MCAGAFTYRRPLCFLPYCRTMNISEWLQLAQLVVSTFTVFGIFYASKRFTDQHHTTEFEDNLSREYRQIMKDIPIKAFLGEELNSQEQDAALGAFFRYVDLCNEQVDLQNQLRITEKTWQLWSDGIISNLKLPAFQMAWSAIRLKSNNFGELSEFLRQRGFDSTSE